MGSTLPVDARGQSGLSQFFKVLKAHSSPTRSAHSATIAVMSTAVKPQPITVEQYLSFECPPGFRDELIDGEIVVSPDRKPLHHDIATNIFVVLDRKISDLYGLEFKVGQRTNMRMPDRHSMPSPDVWVMPMSSWREARLADTYPLGAPILAVEVVSRANSKAHVQQKVDLYLSEGSVEVWVVHPKRQTLTVHRKNEQPQLYAPAEQPESHRLSVPFTKVEVFVPDIFRLL